MKTILTGFFVSLIFLPEIFCQQSSNINLLANINNHSSDGLYSACWGYTAPNCREYGILGANRGTAFIDVTDSNNIREVGYIPGLGGSCCREMKTFSHYAYVVTDISPGGLQIIDLQYLPDSVHLVNTFFFTGFTNGHTISQFGAYLFINAGNYRNGGLFVLDLSNDPVNPIKLGEWEEQVVHDCRIVNDTIYACNIYEPPGTISVIDATDKKNLRTVTSWRNVPQPSPHNIAISSDRKYAFVTDELGSSPPRMLKVWNIENLFNVIFVTSWQPTGITTSIIHNVELYGRYLLAAHYTAGVRVVDVLNPQLINEVGWYDTYPLNNGFTYDGCWAVYKFPSGKIFASDRQTGAYVLRTTFDINEGTDPVPTSYFLKQNYPNPFNPLTSIEFALPDNTNANISIFDSRGSKVATLFDGFSVGCFQKLSFDGSNFASGIYYCRLLTKDFSKTIKMVLLK